MMRAKRPLLASVLASVLTLAASGQALAWDPAEDRPGEVAMISDALLVRPIMLASTVIGIGLFAVTLPVSILGGNEDEAAEKLVAAPARATFLRCLGCTPAQNERLQAKRRTERANRELDEKRAAE